MADTGWGDFERECECVTVCVVGVEKNTEWQAISAKLFRGGKFLWSPCRPVARVAVG